LKRVDAKMKYTNDRRKDLKKHTLPERNKKDIEANREIDNGKVGIGCETCENLKKLVTDTKPLQEENNKVLIILMKQEMQGNIPGTLGGLGDLGGIDQKYDVAFST
jgi:chromosome segregation ATPase